MKKTNRLHTLISSLSRAEKTYFKKFASIHTREGIKNYIRLFDALAAQKEYDEEKLKKLLKGSPVMRYFSATQHYLYRTILKALRNYHSDESSHMQTLGLLQDAHLLTSKGFYEHSYKVLDAAKQKAVTSEHVPALLYVYDRLYRGYFQKPDKEKCQAWKKTIYPAIIDLTGKLKELAEVENLVVDSFLRLYLKYGMDVSGKDARYGYKKILSDPLLSPGRAYNNMEAAGRALTLKAIIHSVLGDYKMYYETVHDHQQRIEANPLFRSGDMQQRAYIKVLLNKITACAKLRRTNELESTFQKLQSIKPANEAQEIEIFSYGYVNITGAYISLGMAEKALTLVPVILAKMKKFSGSLSVQTVYNLQANIVTLYFISGDYQRALEWINWRGVTKDTQLDASIAIRILSILVHYELGNLQLAESLLLALRRFLIKQKAGDSFHRLILRHIRKLTYTLNKTEVYQQLVQFKKDWDAVSGEETGKSNNIAIYFWLERKIAGLHRYK